MVGAGRDKGTNTQNADRDRAKQRVRTCTRIRVTNCTNEYVRTLYLLVFSWYTVRTYVRDMLAYEYTVNNGS